MKTYSEVVDFCEERGLEQCKDWFFRDKIGNRLPPEKGYLSEVKEVCFLGSLLYAQYAGFLSSNEYKYLHGNTIDNGTQIVTWNDELGYSLKEIANKMDSRMERRNLND